MTPWHQTILREWKNSDYKILAVGRKGRKTTFDINELFMYAMTDDRGLTYAYIAPSRKQAQEIVWDDHVAKILLECVKVGMPYKLNNSSLTVKFPGYSTFSVDGSDNIEALRGKSDWGGVVLDEFSSWRHPRYAWEEVIEPNLLVHRAWCVISGTPKGYNYFHSLMKMGDHECVIEGDAFDEDGGIVKTNKSFQSYRFTSYDNPWVDKVWLDNKRERLTETSFNQEYLARFEKHTGLIYKEFDRNVHIVEPFAVPSMWTKFGAIDFGYTNPTAHLFIAIDSDLNIYVYDEYYERERTTQSNANVLKTKWGTVKPQTIWGDPGGIQEIMDYGNEGLFITPAVRVLTGDDKSWVNSGIDKVAQLLKVSSKTNKPKLFVFRTCTNLIREFENYRWLENKKETLNEKDVPLKTEDHAIDALRYFVVSTFTTHIGDVLATWPD